MIELIDWDEFEPQPPGTPGWGTLAVKLSGHTRRPADRVFAAVEHAPEGGRCRVLLVADIPESGPDALTPFVLTVRVREEDIDTFVVAGATTQREIRVATP